MEWINECKIAIVNDNLEKMVELGLNLPDTNNMGDVDQLQTLAEFLSYIIARVQNEQSKLSNVMHNIKRAKTYLGAPNANKKLNLLF